MEASSQQKILGYFIEEAKEHLETLEKGLMDLATTASDSESLNELFRAAHSVKGGGAMLGYSSIQKIAHRLEDAFKILKENDVVVDQRLESLFLKGFDALHDLVEQLQGPFGLREEDAEEILQASEPTFNQLQSYHNQLLTGEAPKVTGQGKAAPAKPDIAAQTKPILHKMLQVFKGKSNADSRKQLKALGDQLIAIAPQQKQWVILVKTAQKAIYNPKYSYRTLAPIVIKELKQGSDLLHLGKVDDIAASQSLKRLAGAKTPQVLIPVEPKAAAKLLTHSFNKQQLSQLMKLLAMAK
ncbi:MAG: Hpt domain-containing protein [Chroococcales cyanobacterium]